MLGLLHAWVLFPLVLALLSLGCGLAVERVGGTRLSGSLLLPTGFAATIVIAGLATSLSATAQLAVPGVVAIAAAGLLAGLTDRRRPDPWTIASVLLVFVVYAAPVVLSGSATFAGYIKLDDTATWLGLVDHVLAHGRDVGGLQPSTYAASLFTLLRDSGYPVGSIVPLGVGAKVAGADIAWTFQPYLAFQAALLALCFHGLLRGLVRNPWARAAVVFVAAQPALLYGYALWGGVKELVTVPLLALLAALVLDAARKDQTVRGVLPLAVGSAALLHVVSVGGAVWLGLALLPALLLFRRVSLREFALRVGAFAVALAVLALPIITTVGRFFVAAKDNLTPETEFGNLAGPLSKFQVAGIWLRGDFRNRPGDMTLTYVLIGVTIAAAAVGLAWVVYRRHGSLVVYVAVSLVSCVIITSFGSPWIDGKIFAITSPAVLLAAGVGVALAFARGNRVVSLLAGSAIAVGVLWSTVLAYHVVWLAPRSQLAELEYIGKRFAGDSPALINEYQPYGARHFLRRLEPEASGEYRYRRLTLRDGSDVQKGSYADIDELRLRDLLVYKTVVLPRGPEASTPPSVYSLAWSGRYYDVWQRADRYPQILEHFPLGDSEFAAGPAPCDEVMRLARLAAGRGGFLVAVPRRHSGIVSVQNIAFHARNLSVPPLPFDRGVYDVWLRGTFTGRMVVSLDGRTVGARRHHLEHPGQWVPFGSVRVNAGNHVVTLSYSGPDLHPGSAALPSGPVDRLALRKRGDPGPRNVAPAQARSLCGKNLDWIDAVSG